MGNENKQALIAFFSSAIFLFSIFLSTMLTHFNGRIDWTIFGLGLAQIVLVSMIPTVVVKFTKISKWYFSVATGAVLGFLAAFVIIKVKTGI